MNEQVPAQFASAKTAEEMALLAYNRALKLSKPGSISEMNFVFFFFFSTFGIFKFLKFLYNIISDKMLTLVVWKVQEHGRLYLSIELN